jgi:hypothetical protein
MSIGCGWAWPIDLGTSGGNIEDRTSTYCCSGTLGALVEDGSGTQYILSNNHVLAKSNNAAVGDDVNQPGMIDQNCAPDGVVADLSDWVDLKFKQGRSRPSNKVDAAIAEVRPGAVGSDGTLLDIGPISGTTLAATPGLAVQKSGRTSGHTTGTATAIDVTVDVGYSRECGGASNQVARFNNQIRISDASFSTGGDSGSLILEAGASGLPCAVGLLFAGSSSSTIANPIDDVLSAFGVTLVAGSPPVAGPEGSISGVVTNADDSTAIAGASVSVDSGQSATTASDGSYSLTNVPAGSRTVSVSASGFGGDSTGVTVLENADTVVDFALTPATVATQAIATCVTFTTSSGKGGTKNMLITFHVEDDLGNPVSGAAIDINVTRNGTDFGSGSGATTNSAGDVTYNARNAADGVYETIVTNVVASGLSFEGSTPTNSFKKGTDATPAAFCNSASGATSSDSAAPVSLQKARAANRGNSDALFGIPGVVGHGVGVSEDGGSVIEVYLSNGASRGQVPAALDNVPVRVVVTGDYVAL